MKRSGKSVGKFGKRKIGSVSSGASATGIGSSAMSRQDFLKTAGVAAAGAGAAAVGFGGVSKAYHPPGSSYSPYETTPPDPNYGGTADISRDEYGVPHISADTDYDLFYGLGYATAEDRLFQYYTFKLAGHGRLSELLGPGEIETDIGLRLYYTQPDDVLSQQYQALNPKFKEAIAAWTSGMNAYITEMKTRLVQYGDPSLIPFEFLYFESPYQGVMPEYFTVEDLLGVGSYLTVENAAGYTDQLTNLFFLSALQEKFKAELCPPPPPEDPYYICPAAKTKAMAVFNDIAWFDDPEAEVTVPVKQGKAYKKLLAMPSEMPDFSSAQFYIPASNHDMEKRLRKAGVSMRFGSNTLAIHQSKSHDGPLFGAGFQLSWGREAPPLTNEAHLTGGESNFNIRGACIGPLVIAGRKKHFNYTALVGYGANNDWYQEEIMPGGPTGLQYKFNGNWVPFEPIGLDAQNQNVILVWNNGGTYEYSDDFGQNWNPCEVDPALAPAIPFMPSYAPFPSYWLFKALGSNPLVFPLLRSVHGPLMGLEGPYGFTIRRVNYGTEYKHAQMFFELGLANTFDEFKIAVRKNDANQHISYTGYKHLEDGEGAAPIIAYFFTGAFPDRLPPTDDPDSDPRFYKGDPRLPRDGRGFDEWQDVVYPHIELINPSTGFIANWNSKPGDFPYGCAGQSYWSIGHGVHRIQRNVMAGLEKYKKLTAGEPDPFKYGRDLEDILKEIQSNYYRFDSFYYLRPHLLMAAAELDGHAIHSHSHGPEALNTIKNWDLNAFDPPTNWDQDELYELVQLTLQLSANYIGLQMTYGDLEDYFDTSTSPPTPVGDCASGWPPACEKWYDWLLEYGALYADWQYRWGNEDPGFVLFKKWADAMHDALFSDALSVSYQPYYLQSTTPRYAKLIHVLDYELNGYSGVPPSYSPEASPTGGYIQALDYFDQVGVPGTPGNRKDAIWEFMLDKLVEALNELGYPWDNKPREIYEINTSVGPCGFVGDAEWITFCQVISYHTGIAKNRLETGQSGFITVYPFPHEDNFVQVQLPSIPGWPEYVFFDKNMFSQMALLYNFKYKDYTLD